MAIVVQERSVFLVESEHSDVVLTTKALQRVLPPLSLDVATSEAAGVARYNDVYAQCPPRIVLLSDRCGPSEGLDFIQAVRSLHDRERVLIACLLSGPIHECAEGCDFSIVKPIDYHEFMNEVLSLVRSLLA